MIRGTPSEWRAIRAKARAVGMDISAWILSRCWTERPRTDRRIRRPAIPTEQRRHLELLKLLVADSRRFLDEPFMPGIGATLREAVALLVLSCGIDGAANRTGPVNWPDAKINAGTGPVNRTAAEIRAGPGPETPTAVESETGPGREMRTTEDPDPAPPSEANPLKGDFLDDLVAELNQEDDP